MKIIQKEIDHIPSGYTRVTDVLSPYNNFSGIPQDVLKNAADRGSRVHTYCEMYALNLFYDEVDEDCKGYLDSYINWFDKYVSKVVFTEKRINHKEYKISGKPDQVLILKGDYSNFLLDNKTPLISSYSWQLQTAAYQILIEDCLHIEIGRRGSLQLRKDGSPAKLIEYSNHELDKYLYLKALQLFRFFKK